MFPLVGRALWSLFHGYFHRLPAGFLTAAQIEGVRIFLEAFDATVIEAGAQGCACAKDWPALRAQHPAPLGPETTGPALFWWSVDMHDHVNRKLGKPVVGPAWRRECGMTNAE